MFIRTYHSGDEDNIIKLNDTVLKEYGFAFSPELDRDLLDIPKYYMNRNGQYFLLIDGEIPANTRDSGGSAGNAGEGKIVGSIAISKISKKVCKMRHFYTYQEYRGKGWGTKLYQEALKFAKDAGYREIWLSTAPQFRDAIAFYEHHGFRRSLRPLWHYRRAGIFYVLKLGN